MLVSFANTAHCLINSIAFSSTCSGSKCLIPQRYVLTLMGFLALFNAFAMRANLTIAITKMTFPVNNSDGMASQDESVCPMPDNLMANTSDLFVDETDIFAVSRVVMRSAI